MKIQRISLISILMMVLCLQVAAQEMKVKSFEKLERDLFARTQERLDANDEPCGVLRVAVPHAEKLKFEGAIVGDVIYNPSEAIIYMPDLSKNITIQSSDYGLIEYTFPERIRKQTVYRLTLSLIESDAKKIRTLVMPVLGVGGPTSYGLMLGVVRNTGPYIKVKANFKSLSADRECNDQGFIDGGESYAWFTGATKKTRFALTGGVLQRIKPNIYAYGGLGFGQCNYGWQTTDGEWVKNTDHSFSGMECDLGALYRYKNYAISIGYQTNSFKYHEATIGVGVMF